MLHRQGSNLSDAVSSALAVERLTLDRSSAAATGDAAAQQVLTAITRPVLAQLDGHEGSIHRCRSTVNLICTPIPMPKAACGPIIHRRVPSVAV